MACMTTILPNAILHVLCGTCNPLLGCWLPRLGSGDLEWHPRSAAVPLKAVTSAILGHDILVYRLLRFLGGLSCRMSSPSRPCDPRYVMNFRDVRVFMLVMALLSQHFCEMC